MPANTYVQGVINELGMLTKEPCRERVVAKGYVDLYLLRRADFDDVLEAYKADVGVTAYIEDRGACVRVCRGKWMWVWMRVMRGVSWFGKRALVCMCNNAHIYI